MSPLARLAAALLPALLLAGARGGSPVRGYAPAEPGDTLRPQPGDTLRPQPEAAAPAPARSDARTVLRAGTTLDGFLSEHGLPPRPGRLTLTDTGLVFRSGDGRLVQPYPLVGPIRHRGGQPWRASAIVLAYVDADRALPVYFFRVEGSVFATEAPGALLDVAGHPAWLDSLASREWSPRRTLAAPEDSAAILGVARRIEASGYADTLYALFGRPTRPLGLVGARGRQAGRLGEYIASRDSLALDPARITSEEQLRHAMAHELGHRWQGHAPAQLRTLWRDVAPIRDSRRYGHGSVAEHQAEAIAFAVHYLQITAFARPGTGALDLLDRYELLVPGTRIIARYLALRPVYAHHPLRPVLIGGPPA